MAGDKRGKRKVAYTQDLKLRNGGYIRTWFSIDVRNAICVEGSTHVYCNRLTRGEVRKLITRLTEMLGRKP